MIAAGEGLVDPVTALIFLGVIVLLLAAAGAFD